jgi:multiple antibiotic resistance protein
VHNWRTYTHIAIALFVIADPIGAIPLFLSLTRDQTRVEKNCTALATAGTVAGVLVLAAFFGGPLLQIFGIRIASFRVGGGILILLMAIAMLYARPGRTTPEEAAEAAGKHDLAIVPLAVPLIAGPGAISSVILYAQQTTAWFDTVILVFTILFVATSVWVALRLADPISMLLGGTGINIITRLLGLLLSAIAIEFITTGLIQLMPGLAARP